MNFCPALRISWIVWVKFDVRDLHLPSLRNYEFGDIRYGGSYALLKRVNEILPNILRFSFDFLEDKTVTGDVHRHLQSEREFR
jgi:hypothetical protein